MRRVAIALLVALGVTASAVGVRTQAPAQPAQPAPDPVRLLLDRIEQAVQAGDASRFTALLAPAADRVRIENFTSTEFPPGATRVVIQERDRQPLKGTPPDDGHRLIVERLRRIRRARAHRHLAARRDARGRGRPVAHRGRRAPHVGRATSTASRSIRRSSTTRTTSTITAEDLELTLARGSVFVADTDQGVTGLVLLGQGRMRFSPRPETEKGQVKIFCGSETLDTRFDAAFIRINPGDFESSVPADRLVPRAAVDPRDFKRADEVFREEVPKSFGLELGDLSARRVVARAGRRRLPRRDPDAPFRHADLRAVGVRAGGHHALRPAVSATTSRCTRRRKSSRSAARSTTRTTCPTTTSSTTASTSRSRPTASGSTDARRSR